MLTLDDDLCACVPVPRRRIGRIRELQQRAVGLAGSGIVASLIGVSNFLARLAYEVVYIVGYPD